FYTITAKSTGPDVAPNSYPGSLRVWQLPFCTIGATGQGAEPLWSAAPLWRIFAATSTIHGYRPVQSKPLRENRRTRSPSRSTRSRYPSYFTSWSQSGPLGTAVAFVGRQNSNNVLRIPAR